MVVIGAVVRVRLGPSPTCSASPRGDGPPRSPLLGLFLAGVSRAEATLAAANLVYLLLLAGGAVVLPISAYGAFGDVVRWLPLGALRQRAMRCAFIDGGVTSWRDLLVLCGWAAVGTTLTARTFKWE